MHEMRSEGIGMEILNEKIEVLGEVRLGAGVIMKYCHIRYKNDGGSRYPAIIIEKGDALNRTTETTFVIEKDFIELFLKPLHRKLGLSIDTNPHFEE